MALTDSQKASRVFKGSLGIAESTTARDFFEEPYATNPLLPASKVWKEDSLIPSTAPVGMAPDEIRGVVQRKVDLVLTAIPGTSNAFYNALLKDAIPFNFDPAGSYNYAIKDSLDNPIAFGQGDWLIDTQAGVLTFYGTVPSNMPPKVSFYKYVGAKGVGGGVSIAVTDTVVNAEALTGKSNNDLMYCVANETWYRYTASGSSYTRDGKFILNTADARNTRWLAESGRYIIGQAGTDNGGITLGTTDSFGRNQIWNAAPSASLRLGSLGQDGDPNNTASEGIVVYGTNSNGVFAPNDWAFVRIKSTRLGINNCISNVQNYIFRADEVGVYTKDNSGNKTFNLTRATGVLTFYAETINNQITTPAPPASGFNKLYFKGDDKLYKQDSSGTETEVGGAIADWATSTVYSIGNYVLYNDTIFKCITGHTSSTFLTDLANWQITSGIFSLPTADRITMTPGFDGVIVRDSTDNKLYRSNGVSWIEV